MDKATVKKIATLARLRVNDEQMDKYATELGNIMQFVEQLGEVNTDNVEPLASVSNIKPKMREDKVTDGNIQADILANAPEAQEGFFIVPKIVE